MYYLFIEVFDSSYQQDIYLALQSIGVQKAITVEARNIASVLGEDHTFFTGFFKSDKIDAGDLSVIQALVESKELIREFLNNLKEAGINIEKENIMSFTAVPSALTFSMEEGLRES